MQLDILGAKWNLVFKTSSEDPLLNETESYIDSSVKKIVIKLFKKDINSKEDLEAYTNSLIRHEIIKAYIVESGLTYASWSFSDSMVQFFATQIPKMWETFLDYCCQKDSIECLTVDDVIKLNILGSHWTLEHHPVDKVGFFEAMNGDGLCDSSVKKIVIGLFEKTDKTKEDLDLYTKSVVRHELVHAYAYESGLDVCSRWATNEEMIDYFALQMGKIIVTFDEARVTIDDEVKNNEFVRLC